MSFVQDLIHGAPIGKPVSNRCHVTMFYVEDDGTETRYSRSIINSSSEYRIESKVSDFVHKDLFIFPSNDWYFRSFRHLTITISWKIFRSLSKRKISRFIREQSRILHRKILSRERNSSRKYRGNSLILLDTVWDSLLPWNDELRFVFQLSPL